MSNLVFLKANNIPFTTSEVVAEYAKVKHHAIQQMILKHESSLKRFGTVAFEMRKLSGELSVPCEAESTDKPAFKMRPLRQSATGQSEKIYHLNEEQATLLITFLKNTEPVIQFKIELVRQFFQMRQMLFQRQTLDWQETRRAGKLTRQEETDVISELAEYAKEQGSKNSQRLYMVYSKLANKIAGVESREIATITQINNLSLIEHIILHVIRTGMRQGKHYKEIYQDSKFRLEQFSDIACLNNGTLSLTGTDN